MKPNDIADELSSLVQQNPDVEVMCMVSDEVSESNYTAHEIFKIQLCDYIELDSGLNIFTDKEDAIEHLTDFDLMELPDAVELVDKTLTKKIIIWTQAR